MGWEETKGCAGWAVDAAAAVLMEHAQGLEGEAATFTFPLEQPLVLAAAIVLAGREQSQVAELDSLWDIDLDQVLAVLDNPTLTWAGLALAPAHGCEQDARVTEPLARVALIYDQASPEWAALLSRLRDAVQFAITAEGLEPPRRRVMELAGLMHRRGTLDWFDSPDARTQIPPV